MSGLEVLRRLRAAGHTVDVIATTRARDLSVVQAAVSFGVTQYLVKPFTSAVVRQKLERHSAYRASLAGAGLPVAQGEIDSLFGALRQDAAATGLPKGIAPSRCRPSSPPCAPPWNATRRAATPPPVTPTPSWAPAPPHSSRARWACRG